MGACTCVRVCGHVCACMCVCERVSCVSSLVSLLFVFLLCLSSLVSLLCLSSLVSLLLSLPWLFCVCDNTSCSGIHLPFWDTCGCAGKWAWFCRLMWWRMCIYAGQLVGAPQPLVFALLVILLLLFLCPLPFFLFFFLSFSFSCRGQQLDVNPTSNFVFLSQERFLPSTSTVAKTAKTFSGLEVVVWCPTQPGFHLRNSVF